MSSFLGEPGQLGAVESLNDFRDKCFVVLHARKVATPTDDQRLGKRRLQSVVSLFDDTVFVRSPWIDPS